MRRHGAAYGVIAEELGVSRSTAYGWTRDVVELPRTPRRSRREEQVRAARTLRQQGRQYVEIAEQLGVAVATAHTWASDVVVRGDDQRDLGGRTRTERRETSRRAWEPRLRESGIRRQQAKLAAAQDVGELPSSLLAVVAAMAYWCEGAKDEPWERREQLQFINSDPVLIRLFLGWLRAEGVPDERIRLRVSIHETADVSAVEEAWAAELGA